MFVCFWTGHGLTRSGIRAYCLSFLSFVVNFRFYQRDRPESTRWRKACSTLRCSFWGESRVSRSSLSWARVSAKLDETTSAFCVLCSTPWKRCAKKCIRFLGFNSFKLKVSILPENVHLTHQSQSWETLWLWDNWFEPDTSLFFISQPAKREMKRLPNWKLKALSRRPQHWKREIQFPSGPFCRLRVWFVNSGKSSPKTFFLL